MVYHIWRKFPTAPFIRYACSIEQAKDAADGYRLTKTNPVNGNPEFLRVVHAHMTSAANVVETVMGDGFRATTGRQVLPGEVGHFDAAVRTIPHAAIGPVSE